VTYVPVKRVFVSHSSFQQNERTFLAGLQAELAKSYDVLVDQTHLQPGVMWRDEIYSWLAICDAAVILLSESAKRDDSKWVPRESMVLRWRKQIDPKFPLIPMYLPGFDRPDLDKAPFQDLGLAEIDAEVVADWTLAGGHYNTICQTLANAVNATSALDETARVVLGFLNGIDESTLEKAIEQVPLDLGKWDALAAPDIRLAIRLAHYGISGTEEGTQPAVEAIRILKKFSPSVPASRWSDLVDALADNWVNPCTAAYFSRFRPGRPRRVLVLNASSRDTVGACVSRACSGDTVSSWPLFDILPGSGEGEAAKDLRSQVVNTYALSRLPGVAAQERDAGVRKAFQQRGKRGEPVFFTITNGNKLGVQELVSAQDQIHGELKEGAQTVTFVYVCGPAFPPTAGHQAGAILVRPELEPGAEEKAKDEYLLANDLIQD
jgi:hypothetical protein